MIAYLQSFTTDNLLGIFMQPIFYLTYASRMTWYASLNKNVFVDIYQTANDFNDTQDITGFLCFGDGYFFQYLEGDETKVRALYDNICRDNRHTQVTLLSVGYLSEKRFGQWDMAFINMHSPNIDPKMVEFFGLLTPLLWQQNDIDQMITLFENNCNTPHFINKQIEQDNLIYRYAGLYHLFRMHRKFLILQIILILVAIFIIIILYFYTKN